MVPAKLGLELGWLGSLETLELEKRLGLGWMGRLGPWLGVG